MWYTVTFDTSYLFEHQLAIWLNATEDKGRITYLGITSISAEKILVCAKVAEVPSLGKKE